MATRYFNVLKSVTEDIKPCVATLKGSYPSWLRGRLLRTGPARYEVGSTSYRHFFDGLGMLHCFTIEDTERVTYSARFVQSKTWRDAKDSGRIEAGEFGTEEPPDPCKSIFQRFRSRFSLPRRTDNCNVNVFPLNGKWMVSSETSLNWQFDPETLDAVKRHDVARASGLTSPKSGLLILNTAHPHPAGNGEIYNFGLSLGRNTAYQFMRMHLVSADSHSEEVDMQSDVLCSIPVESDISYFHSFALTRRHALLVEQPLKYGMFDVTTMAMRGKSFLETLRWRKDVPCRLHVIDLETNRLLKTVYETDPFFTFHHVNAYEVPEKRQIIVDVSVYPDAQIVYDFYLSRMRGEDIDCTSFPPAAVRRLFVSLGEDANKLIKVPYEDISTDYNLEFPQVNYRNSHGAKYQFAYGCTQTHSKLLFDSLIKLDVDSKEEKVWYAGDGMYPSEPIFVASPAKKGEDDGVLLSAVVSDDPEKQGFLAVLDAVNFKEIARAEVPCRMPYTLHGMFSQSLN